MINHSGKMNNFATIFDGNSLNDWQMAGQGKVGFVKEEAALQSECLHAFQLTYLTSLTINFPHCSIVRLRTTSLLNCISLLIQNLSLLQQQKLSEFNEIYTGDLCQPHYNQKDKFIGQAAKRFRICFRSMQLLYTIYTN